MLHKACINSSHGLVSVYSVAFVCRTTVSNHKKRLPLLFDTWITKVNSSQLFLVTDGNDPVAKLMTSVTGMYYYIVA